MNAYQILGVSPMASQAEIDSAYEALHRRLRVFHTADNVRRFTEVNAAYALLSNRDARRQIDSNGGEIPRYENQSQNSPSGHRVSQDQAAPQPVVIPVQYCTTVNNYYNSGALGDCSQTSLWVYTVGFGFFFLAFVLPFIVAAAV